jgi:hypothetical protein
MSTIKLFATPYYRKRETLDGNDYWLTVKWVPMAQAWYLDLDSVSEEVGVYIHGIKLICGKDFLSHRGIQVLGGLRMVDNTGEDQDPDFANMGDRYTLEYTEVS